MRTFNLRKNKPLFSQPSTMCLAAGITALTLTPSVMAGKAVNQSPNIVFILTDDQGWSQVSKPMHPDVPQSRSNYLSTPHLNRLGDAGMRFTNGYAPAPICTPTRRSILAGKSAARTGTEFRSAYIPADHLTIPKALKQANPDYLCAHFGKWGSNMASSPQACGYDSSDGETSNNTGGMPASLGVKGGHMDGPPYFIDNEDPKRIFSVTNSAIDFMHRSTEQNRPFYVQLSYYAVHLSIVCREQTLRHYQRKGEPDRGYPPAWAAMMDDMDQGIGRLLDALDEMGLADNTYVFLLSDNGGQSWPMPGGDESRLPVNHPLSGSKQSLLEGGIRVPFLVRGPGIKPKSYSHVPVTGYDLLPTFYDLAGGTAPLPEEIDGGSLRPLFSNPSGAVVSRPLDGLVFHRPGHLSSAIRQGPFKLFVEWNKQGGIKSTNLYNLDSSVVENQQTDIIESNAETAERLQNTLLSYLKDVDAKDPKTIVDYLHYFQKDVRPPQRH